MPALTLTDQVAAIRAGWDADNLDPFEALEALHVDRDSLEAFAMQAGTVAFIECDGHPFASLALAFVVPFTLGMEMVDGGDLFRGDLCMVAEALIEARVTRGEALVMDTAEALDLDPEALVEVAAMVASEILASEVGGDPREALATAATLGLALGVEVGLRAAADRIFS